MPRVDRRPEEPRPLLRRLLPPPEEKFALPSHDHRTLPSLIPIGRVIGFLPSIASARSFLDQFLRDCRRRPCRREGASRSTRRTVLRLHFSVAATFAQIASRVWCSGGGGAAGAEQSRLTTLRGRPYQISRSRSPSLRRGRNSPVSSARYFRAGPALARNGSVPI